MQMLNLGLEQGQINYMYIAVLKLKFARLTCCGSTLVLCYVFTRFLTSSSLHWNSCPTKFGTHSALYKTIMI